MRSLLESYVKTTLWLVVSVTVVLPELYVAVKSR